MAHAKTVTKTSRQAGLEAKRIRDKSTCPECGSQQSWALREVHPRFFRKTQKRDLYGCINCGCEWHTEYLDAY